MNAFILLDALPPEPFTFGATGALASVGFVLFELAVAAGFYFIFRNIIAERFRAIITGFLVLLALAGGVYIWIITSQYDVEARSRYEETIKNHGRGRVRPAPNTNSALNSPSR
jgi:hypothetical protein